MNLFHLFMIQWFMIGLASILFRNKQIWQEQNRPYRFLLVLATAPVGVVFNILSFFALSINTWYRFAKKTVDGIDPSLNPEVIE